MRGNGVGVGGERSENDLEVEGRGLNWRGKKERI